MGLVTGCSCSRNAALLGIDHLSLNLDEAQIPSSTCIHILAIASFYRSLRQDGTIDAVTLIREIRMDISSDLPPLPSNPQETQFKVKIHGGGSTLFPVFSIYVPEFLEFVWVVKDLTRQQWRCGKCSYKSGSFCGHTRGLRKQQEEGSEDFSVANSGDEDNDEDADEKSALNFKIISSTPYPGKRRHLSPITSGSTTINLVLFLLYLQLKGLPNSTKS